MKQKKAIIRVRPAGVVEIYIKRDDCKVFLSLLRRGGWTYEILREEDTADVVYLHNLPKEEQEELKKIMEHPEITK